MAEKHGRLRDLFLSAKGIALYHRMLKRSEHWPIEKLRDYQFENIKALLIHAFENITYYRNLFMDNSFNPYKDFTRIEDLARLPIGLPTFRSHVRGRNLRRRRGHRQLSVRLRHRTRLRVIKWLWLPPNHRTPSRPL